jgi:hypothetical protein
MKSKLLPILLVVLIILNGVLIFMLVKKPHEKGRYHPKGNFLTEQLHFSENQIEKFKTLDTSHRDIMASLDNEVRIQKHIMFNSFAKSSINIDSLTQIIGSFEGKKEKEVFRFFKSVRNICTPEQQNNFDKIINEALKGGKPRGPREGRNHPPKGERMPPPR